MSGEQRSRLEDQRFRSSFYLSTSTFCLPLRLPALEDVAYAVACALYLVWNIQRLVFIALASSLFSAALALGLLLIEHLIVVIPVITFLITRSGRRRRSYLIALIILIVRLVARCSLALLIFVVTLFILRLGWRLLCLRR